MAEKRVKRKLAAILAADVVGYSRLMGEDEAGTLAALKEHQAALIDPAIATHDGRIVKLMGDGILAEFASVVDAADCAVALQREMAERNADVPRDRRIEFRIGINLGDVILDGDDIYGDGVNVAARLEGLAAPGGICISGTVHDALGNKLQAGFDYMGEQTMKNIAKPVRAYRLKERGPTASAQLFKTGAGAPASPGQAAMPSIAVKPFDNASGDPEQDHFADALTQGIMTPLTKLSGLVVIADESPSLIKSKQMSVEEIATTFDVQYVLKGSVRKYGDRVRVNAELMEVSTGRILWAEKFDRDIRDAGELFAIEDEIIEEIVTALDVKLLSGEVGRIVRNALRNPAAREYFYRGEELLWGSATRLEIREAQHLFEEVIRLEPTSSIGYAEAALAYWIEVLAGLSNRPAESLERATGLAHEAIRLDDVTGYALLVLAHVHLNQRNYEQAMAEAERAVLVRPSCPAAHTLKAGVLNYLGRPGDAIEHAQYALRLTPVYPPMYPAILATAFYGSERHEEAIAAAKAAIELDDHGIDPYLILAASNVALGHSEEASWAAGQVLKLKPNFRLADFAESQPYQDRTDLERLMDRLKRAGLQ